VSSWKQGLCCPEPLVPGPTEPHATKACMGGRYWGVGDMYRNSSESPKSTGVLVIWWRIRSTHTFNL